MAVPWWAWVVGVWYVAWSLVAFIAFAIDKRAAEKGQRRTPERTLHMIEALGGFPGAWMAMFLLRHKNRKPWFIATTALMTLAHVAIWAWVVSGRRGHM